jgi:aspartate oxidase
MTRDCAVVRDAEGLQRVGKVVTDIGAAAREGSGVAAEEVVNLATVATAIVAAATAREESRGSHTRADYPETRAELAGRFVTVVGAGATFVPLPTTPAGGDA